MSRFAAIVVHCASWLVPASLRPQWREEWLNELATVRAGLWKRIAGAPRDAVLMNPDDAAEHRLRSGDAVALTNEHGRFTGRVFVAPIARGNLQVHWPEGNALIARGRRDPTGGVPDYNARVELAPAGVAAP